jgi:hypothetical protein
MNGSVNGNNAVSIATSVLSAATNSTVTGASNPARISLTLTIAAGRKIPRGVPTGDDSDEAIFGYGKQRRRAYQATGEYLGSGAQASVKVVISETGERLALRVLRKPSNPEERKRAEKTARRRWDMLTAASVGADSGTPVYREGFETRHKW